MASGSLSASLIHPFGSGSVVMETSSSGSTSVTPPPSGLGQDPLSVNHALLNHHLAMKNERHHQQHRLYQPYNHLTLHHHHHHMQHQHQQHHHLENHYDLSQHYPVASTSGAGLGGGTDSRCSSVSSSGADHHTLTLKSEQPQSSSLETSSLELLDNGNVSLLKNAFRKNQPAIVYLLIDDLAIVRRRSATSFIFWW